MEILFATKGLSATATLNRPKALNALTLGMIRALDAQLAAWAKDPNIRHVVLKGAGEKSFCAGGDVRAVVSNARNRDGDGLVISSSRAILYASTGDDYAEAAANAARALRDEINLYR